MFYSFKESAVVGKETKEKGGWLQRKRMRKKREIKEEM